MTSVLPAALLHVAADPAPFRRAVEVFGGRTVFPDRHEVRDGCLVLAAENQAVCVWLVPLDRGDDPPVLAEVRADA